MVDSRWRLAAPSYLKSANYAMLSKSLAKALAVTVSEPW
jgi:hypothetical protein